MKAIFVLIIIGLMLASAAYVGLNHDPGYVRISIGNWLIESNLYVVALLNAALLIVLFITLSIFRRVRRAQSSVGQWLSLSRAQKAAKKTNEGLLAFLEGNWSDASKLLKSSAEKSATPIVNYLAAAHAANEQGNNKEAEQLLQKAYDKTSDSNFAVGIAKAQMELDQNQLESSLATLIRLKARKPHHPFILKLLRSVYLRLEDWQQLIQLIPELKKVPNADKTKLHELEEQAWRELFTQKADDLQRNNQFDKASEELASLWKKLPDGVRYDDTIILNYATQLIRLQNGAEAETLLRKMLIKNWSDSLVALYGTVKGRDAAEQLITAEGWLKSRPNNHALLLALGRISLQNELWGKALEYFEASNTLHPSKESLAELCRLEQCLGRTKNGESKHLGGLISALALPQLPLPKQEL